MVFCTTERKRIADAAFKVWEEETRTDALLWARSPSYEIPVRLARALAYELQGEESPSRQDLHKALRDRQRLCEISDSAARDGHVLDVERITGLLRIKIATEIMASSCDTSGGCASSGDGGVSIDHSPVCDLPRNHGELVALIGEAAVLRQ
jgi:hypothetical protein